MLYSQMFNQGWQGIMGNEQFSARLNMAFTHSGMKTKAELAEKADMSQQYLNKLLKGRSQRLPPADVVQKLADACGVDLFWLITGQGDMNGGDGAVSRPQPDNADCVPIYSYDIALSCGPGAEQPEYEVADESPVYFKRSWFRRHGVEPELCKRLMATGDSMVPYILPGDYVIVDVSLEARTHIIDNSIYAIVKDGALCCKYLIKLLNGGVRIRSANPEYPTEDLTREQCAERLIICGRVLERSGDL